MKHLLSCEFNMDTACVEQQFSDALYAVQRLGSGYQLGEA